MSSFLSFRKPVGTRTLGIEWECLFSGASTPRLFGTYKKFFGMCQDGSLDNLYHDHEGIFYGIECVSQPLPPEWLKKEVVRFATSMPYHRAVNSSCGVHIHASREWVNKNKLNSLIKFFNLLTDDEYVEAFGRYSDLFAARPATRIHNTRYSAINVLNKKTVEFRVFASSHDVKWLHYCIDCVVYLITNAKRLNKDAFFAFVDANKPKNVDHVGNTYHKVN